MTNQINHDLAYFSPLLPWQAKAWEQVTRQFDDGRLPHGLLASGMAGIGKRDFVWRAVAWLLCQEKSPEGACGACDSCQWLSVGTHPDVLSLPKEDPDAKDKQTPPSIKIDDVRALQDFVQMTSQGVRIVVLDFAERMTTAAANALLKTLEEPRAGVFLFLISDEPSQLLPTIKSRVQTLPLTGYDKAVAEAFVYENLKDNSPEQRQAQARLLLKLADFAPLSALHMAQSAWFDKRLLWLKTFVALQTGTRQAVAASDYWQSVLSFGEFVFLSRLMLVELWRIGLGLKGNHEDIDTKAVLSGLALTQETLTRLLTLCDDMAISARQNVQEKHAYDRLLVELSE